MPLAREGGHDRSLVLAPPPRWKLACRGEILLRRMSRENVEIVRKTFEDWNRGDLDAIAEVWDEEVVFRTAEGWPERAFHGKVAARSFLEQYWETVGHDTVIEELTDAGSVVVARLHARLSGERSGIEGDQHYTQVATLRYGKAVLVEYFWDHDEALEAAGLRE